MRIESGPARTDRNWQLVRLLVFVGATLWFVYDGAVRYPNQNREAVERGLQAQPFMGRGLTYDAMPEQPTKAEYEALARKRPATAEEVHKALGSPQLTDKADEYFLTKYGRGRITVRPGLAPEIGTWGPWEGGHTKEEIQAQFFPWSALPAIIALFFLWKLYRAATLRVTVDNDGMTYAGRRIAFAEMVSLRDYSPKGWIDLYYQPAGTEQERKLRLDNEKVAKFDEIVDAICQAKGFRNEVRTYAEEQARAAEATEPDEVGAGAAAADEPAEDEGGDEDQPPKN